MSDTIFALSSGAPPAAIAVIRVSGSQAAAALQRLARRMPPPRQATLAILRDDDGAVLDHALVLWLPGPGTATGEDTAELHCHGGRAVVAAIQRALAAVPFLRVAEPGEFTRRAFANGRIDLAEAEGLADLLEAETELQRQAALAMAGGAFSRRVTDWRDQILAASARVEAVLDFGDEDDVGGLSPAFAGDLANLHTELSVLLGQPSVERLREGFKVVLAGPPNAGKSTLFNALVGDEAAITSPVAGTTRDLVVRTVAIEGIPFQFIDTAGLRDETDDPIELVGIVRARQAADDADLILWLGNAGEGPLGGWEIATQSDRIPGRSGARHRISAITRDGISGLLNDLIATARTQMPKPGQVALNQRQTGWIKLLAEALGAALAEPDPLLIAESLRSARVACDALVGQSSTEDMLDELFGRFCIGK